MRSLAGGLGLALALVASAASITSVGCGDSSPAGTTSCSTTGTGTLIVTVVGLPAGVAAAVTVTGPGGAETATATKTFTAVAAGSYTVTAARVTQADPIVRTVFTPSVSATGATGATGAVCVGGTAMPTVTVTYAAVPTSNKLWLSTSNAPTDNNTQAYPSSLLAASATEDAAIGAQSLGGRKQAFDSDGNLWAIGGTVGDPTVLRLPVASLGTSGAKTADRGVTISAIDCVPAVGALAFDAGGALWVSSSCKLAIYKLSTAQLAAGGNVVPALTIASPSGGEGLAFDESGNLWVGTGDDGHLLRFDAASLGAASATPSLTLTAQTSSAGDLHPGWLAFDAGGNLWTSDFGGNLVFSFPAARLTGTAPAIVTPPAVVTVGVSALLGGMAFDEGGGLWLALGGGSFARLAPAQLLITTDAGAPTVPERTITSANLGYTEDLAFYPAPAALPLYSALP